MKKIAVIGAGISGLTCAVRLLEEGYEVSVLTRDDPRETTSSVAAALWFPFRAYPLDRVVDWSLESLQRFRILESESASGVRTVRVREVYRIQPPPPAWRTTLPGFEKLDRAAVPDGFAGGFAMNVPVIDSSRYLPFLLRRLESMGGELVRHEITEFSEINDAETLVNCSGVGAKQLVGDESVSPIRGQVVRVRKGEISEAIVDEGSAKAAYIVPRNDDCILGTTVEEGTWDRSPSDESTRDIVERCLALDQRVSALEILDVAVGLRPGRPEVRLEAERIEGRVVVHNYGHGGSGYTLSWGCAESVTKLVESH